LQETPRNTYSAGLRIKKKNTLNVFNISVVVIQSFIKIYQRTQICINPFKGKKDKAISVRGPKGL
jgi:hypothetical protein